MHKLTATVVSRMALSAQGNSPTPDIPDDWEHVQAPGKPVQVHTKNHRSFQHGMKLQAKYQREWRDWNERDIQARIEQWEARDGK